MLSRHTGRYVCANAERLCHCAGRIKGSSPTPQQDLVRVMSAPHCTLVRRHALVAKWLRYKTSRENPPGNCYRTAGQRSQTDAGEPSRGRIYADVNGFLDPVDSVDNWLR